MTIIEMFKQSAVLTVLGMSIVFVFLWIMIICVTIVGKLVHRMGLDTDVPAPMIGPPSAANKTVAPELTAAITAAVIEHRKTE